MSCILSVVNNHFSQTRYVEERRAAGLHPIDELKRFRLLVVCLCGSTCISMVYIFDLFTTDFRYKFDLSAGDMATISTVGMSVCWFVLPYGFLYNCTGPVPMFVISAMYGFTGCTCLMLALKGIVPGNLATICVFYTLMNASSGLIDAATVVTLAQVFPRNRGPIIALAKVMTGLGSSMWASISLNLFDGDIASFVTLLMFLVPCVNALCIAFVCLPPYIINPWRRRGKTPDQIARLESLKSVYHKKNVPLRRLVVIFIVVASLIIFFSVSTPVKAYTHISKGSRIFLGILTIVIFACFTLSAMPFRWLGGVEEPDLSLEGKEEHNMESGDGSGGVSEKELYLAKKNVEEEQGEAAAVVEEAENTEQLSAEPIDGELLEAHNLEDSAAHQQQQLEGPSRQDPRYGGTIWDNIKKPDIWLLLVGFCCQSALGNMVLYNASTISVALSGARRSKELSSLYITFLGVGSALGRISMGLFEAYVQHQDPNAAANKRRWLVTIALLVSPILATIAGILLLFIPGNMVLLPFIIVYFEEGFFNAIRAIIYPCLFESDHAVYYNMSFISSIVSIICFNRLLFGLTVDSKHNSLGFPTGVDCNVRECVRMPIIVATSTSTLAVVLVSIVHIRYSRFVSRVRARDLVEG